MLNHRKPKPQYSNVTDQLLLGLFRGALTEELARIRLSERLTEGCEFRDGHDQFEAPNFKACEESKWLRPANLDLVETEKSTGNVVSVYEVKSTESWDKKEFNVNGQCGIFMGLAAALGIPTYLIVVRLDRPPRQDILQENKSTGEVSVNQGAYNAELAHFMENAKFELYPSGQFRIYAGMFIVEGELIVL